jgi:hypothetical protein
MINDACVDGFPRTIVAVRPPWCGAIALALCVFLGSLFVARSAGAHETIDTEQVNAILAATDAANTRLKTVVAAQEAEAAFALGMTQVEATAVLNRDLAAHSGRLTFNAETLQKELTKRSLAPGFDEAIGRYRLPTAALERALRLAPQAPDALRARFELLKAGFYESFVLDPFQLVGMSFDALDRQIAEAKALASALSTPDDAEEAAFIHAVDLARAARLVRESEAARSYAGLARTALGAFAEAYPQSMRAASAAVLLKSLSGPNDPN